MRDVAAPYETAAANARMPAVSNIGPNQIAAYQARNRAIARHFYRTDGLLRGAYNNLAQFVVGTGPVPRTKFRELLPLWQAWASQSDPTRSLPFGLQLHAAYLDSELTGDTLIRLRPRRESDGLIVPLQLQLLESEHMPVDTKVNNVTKNRIVAGVEIDPIDGPAAYWLHRRHPNDVTLMDSFNNEPVRVPASEVLHLFRPARMGSYRGESRAVAALVSLWRLHGYVDAEMLRKKLVASLSGFLKDMEDQEIVLPGMENAETAADTMMDVLHWEYGQLIQLPSSTDIKFPNIVDTSGNSASFIRLLGLIISAALGMPYELVFGDLTDVSDRVLEMSNRQFDLFIAAERQRIEHQVCNVVWRRFVDLCVATGLWVPPKGVPQHHWYDVKWTWPVRSYKHPVQDIAAKLEAMKAGLIDRDTLIEELGYDPEEVDLRHAMAMTRAYVYRLRFDSHIEKTPTQPQMGPDGQPIATDEDDDVGPFHERMVDLWVDRINAILDEIEGAEADEGVLK